MHNQQNKGNIITFVVALLGLIKLTAQAFGYDLGFDAEWVNAVANDIAIVVTLGGLFLHNHLNQWLGSGKKKKPPKKRDG